MTIILRYLLAQVSMNVSVETLRGFTKKLRKGEIMNMTGISAPYEIPVSPDLEIDTVKESTDISVNKIFKFLEKSYMGNYVITHLKELESEAIFVI